MRPLLFREVLAPDWTKAQPRAGLVLVLAIACALSAGIAAGHARYGVLIASGAFSVGFGSFQELRGSRILPMLLAAVGMSASSVVGTLTGLSPTAAVIASAAAAWIYARISDRSQAASWVALQCGIWLVISTGYPEAGFQAFTRGLLILTGGLLQTTLTAAWYFFAGARIPEWSGHVAPAPMQRISAIGATLTLGIAAALNHLLAAQGLAPQNGYWIPMTALIVLRSGLHQTVQRGLARTLGTMLGAALATVIVTATLPSERFLAAAVVVFAWASYLLLNVNYTYYAACLTGYVVFLLSLAGVSEHPLVVARVAFTAIGGGLALLMHWLFARKEGTP